MKSSFNQLQNQFMLTQQSIIKDLSDKIKHLNTKLNKSQLNYQTLKSKNTKLSYENDMLRKQLDYQQKECKTRHHNLDKLKAKNHKLKSKVIELEAQISVLTHKKCINYQQTNHKSERQLQNKQETQNTPSPQNKIQISIKQQQLIRYKQINKQQKNQIKSYRSKLQQIDNKMKQNIDQKQYIIQANQKFIHDLQQSLQKILSKTKQLQRQNTELSTSFQRNQRDRELIHQREGIQQFIDLGQITQMNINDNIYDNQLQQSHQVLNLLNLHSLQSGHCCNMLFGIDFYQQKRLLQIQYLLLVLSYFYDISFKHQYHIQAKNKSKYKWIMFIGSVGKILNTILSVTWWSESDVNPVYCSIVTQYGLSTKFGILYEFYCLYLWVFLVIALNVYTKRKFFLIALGGPQQDARRQQILRNNRLNVGMIQILINNLDNPNYNNFDDVNDLPVIPELHQQQYIQKQGQNNECYVCLSLFKDDPQVPITRTKCNHIFHADCARQWLQSGHNQCPTCRTILY